MLGYHPAGECEGLLPTQRCTIKRTDTYLTPMLGDFYLVFDEAPELQVIESVIRVKM